MFEVEIINASLFQSSSYRDTSKSSYAIDTFVVIKFHGKEIGRTSIVTNSFEPIYNEKFNKTYEEFFSVKERQNQRPCYCESLDIEVYEASPTNGDKAIRLYEAKVPIRNIIFKSYKLLPSSSSKEVSIVTLGSSGSSNSNSSGVGGGGNSNSSGGASGKQIEENTVSTSGSTGSGHRDHHGVEHEAENCRIFVRINRLHSKLFAGVPSFNLLELRQVLSPSSIRNRHLFIDFDQNASGFTYRTGLPGPTVGEILVDRYEYCELKLPVISNSFGDRISATCYGILYLTDLRVIFLPQQVKFPLQNECITIPDDATVLDKKQVLYLHRYTIQIPISSIYECKYFPVTGNVSNNPLADMIESAKLSLAFELLDNSLIEFIITKKPIPRISQRIRPVESDINHPNYITYMRDRLQNVWYRAGLDSTDVEPAAWCARVIDYLGHEMRVDSLYVRWAKYLKLTLKQFLVNASNGEKAWIKKIRTGSNFLDLDYQRYNIQDLDWQFSDLNSSYNLCPTYPSILVFPGLLSDEDLVAAASQRSIGRLPAMVWLHGNTKAALCRSSQPMAGISGNMIEFDRKLCLSIKSSAPMELPLRIADARPKLNANANAVQGKGFENVAFMGGPANASLVFLDIENIHVVRGSFNKVKEGLMLCSLYNSTIDSNTINNTVNSMSSASQTYDSLSSNSHAQITASKWINHIASILRGAAGVADSLMIGHPVLVHCSDGWDRTAQLTTIAQILLDPFYRTAEGFLILIHKEWCSFGHKFEDRTGRSGHSKEVSPIFLQMLDCVFQLTLQYPNYFEFNANYLLYIVQCFHSGFFVTFRGNNERDRLMMSRREATYEEVSLDDMEYSNLSLYMSIILRASSTAMTMLNVNYIPPKVNEKQVQYIRPRYNPGDIDLWREGIFGLNFNILELAGQGMPRVTAGEGVAVTNNMLARFMSYLDTHMDELQSITRDKLEIIKASPYPCPAISDGYFNSSSILNSIYSSYSKTVMSSLGDSSVYFKPDASGSLAPSTEKAIVRIQLWYRAYLISKNVMLQEKRASYEYYDMKSFLNGYFRDMSKSERRRIRAYHRIFTIMSISYLKRKYAIKCELQRGRELTCRQYLEEVINDVVDRGFRVDLALRNASIQERQLLAHQSMMMPKILVDSYGNPVSGDNTKNKSLSARFLKVAGGNLAFLKITSTEDEGMESGEMEESSGSTKQKGSTYGSFMKSFRGK